MFGKTDDLTILKTLTSTLNDSVNGYREAAEKVESNDFRELFTHFADERARASAELQAEIRRLGGDPDTDGSMAGGLHQAWLDLKAAITDSDDKAIINEIERGEDYIKEKFETAIHNEHFTAESREVVSRAFASIREGHAAMSKIKHSLEV